MLERAREERRPRLVDGEPLRNILRILIPRIIMSNEEYGEYSKKRNPSSTWNYFLTSRDRQSAKCKMCSRIIKTAGSSTSGLHGHLRSRHKIRLDYQNKGPVIKPLRTKTRTQDKPLIIIKEEPDIPLEEIQNDSNEDEDEPIIKRSKVDHGKSLVLISRMAALDGIPIKAFCTSIDLRHLFANTGYELPTVPGDIIEIIHMHRDIVAADLKQRLNSLKSAGNKFCLTFEQLNSLNNQRHVSVNIHFKDPEFSRVENLGLLQFKHSSQTAVFLKAVTDCLQQYDISFDEDITAITYTNTVLSDHVGLGIHQQMCLAQGIQLAVVEVLYRHEPTNISNANFLNSDDSDEDIEYNSSFTVIKPRISTVPHLVYHELIDKVRKIVKYFRNSSTRNSLLQSYVRKKYEKEIHLILDCRYKWSSLCEMVGRFLKLKDLVQQALQYLEMDTFISDAELCLLTEIHDSLAVIKATITALCKPNANLLTADAALRFMLRKLDEQNNAVSTNFAAVLRKQIGERRTILSSILQYLHDRFAYVNQEDDETFNKPASNDVVDEIVTMLERLKPQKPNDTDSKKNLKIFLNRMRFDDPLGSDDEDSIERQLEDEINSSCIDKTPKSVSEPQPDLERIIRGEISIYESAGGGRGMYLTIVYENLLSIVPATAEAEQFFYASKHAHKGITCSSEKVLNALYFLRRHFMENSDRCFS